MKIGILQAQGLASEIVRQALANQELNDIVTATIYSKENKNDKEVLPDFREGKIDAIVVAPGAQFSIPNATIVSVTEKLRVTVMPATDTSEDSEGGNAENKADKENAASEAFISNIWKMLQRDFSITNPRIALVSDDSRMRSIVEGLQSKHIFVFGPYEPHAFIDDNETGMFDAIITTNENVAKLIFSTQTDDLPVSSILGMPAPLVTCATVIDENLPVPQEDADTLSPYTTQLLQALYLATDIHRHRSYYDKSHKSPLPKLYHERRDDSEKVRFAVKKEKV